MSQVRALLNRIGFGLTNSNGRSIVVGRRCCSSSKNDDASLESSMPVREEKQHDQEDKKEGIINRLIRLSQSSPEEYNSSAKSRDEIRTAKARYKQVMEEYEDRRDDFLRARQNHRGGSPFRPNRMNERSSPSWRSGVWREQRRWITTTTGFHQDEGITDRLKRMSETRGDDWEPSPGARKARGETRLGEQDFRGETRPRRQDFRDGRGEGHRRETYDRRNSFNNFTDRSEGQTRREGYDRRNNFSYSERNEGQTRRNDFNKDDSYKKTRRNSWSMDESAKYWTSHKYHTGGGSQSSSSANYTRVQRKERPVQQKLKEWGRNFEEEEAKMIANKRIQPKPSSTAVVGDFSSVAESKRKTQPKESEMDLGSLLNQTDADTFGTLSVGPVPVKDYVGKSIREELLKDEAELGVSGVDEPEEDEMRFLPEEKWTMTKLVKRIRTLVDELKVKEAVDTLFAAVEQGGFDYDNYQFQYIYNLLISSCGNVGYVKMAFRLFNDMKKRGYTPRASTCTSLFNACSNATWDAEQNIERMNKLRDNMRDRGIPINQIVYHAMIKGYGRNGDIESAFGAVDEMMKVEGINPNTETFNMLLSACITNTQNGFRHVLVTWRKMQEMRIKPDIYSYNLLLRGIRECGIEPDLQMVDEGEEKKAEKLLRKLGQVDANIRLLPFTTDEENNDLLNLLCLNDKNALMNLNQKLLPAPVQEGEQAKLSYLDLIEALQLPENRFAVFGGIRGFMSQMALDKVGPNLKTVTELGQVINPGDLGDLIMMMKTYKLQPDITFFNIMMKRNYDMGNAYAAKKLVACFPQFHITPNIMTWGIHATGCTNKNMAKEFLAEMDEAKFTPNIQIMGSLLNSAIKNFDPSYVMWVMDEMKARDIKEDAKVVLNLEEFKTIVKKGIISKEMDKPVQPFKLAERLEDLEKFDKSFKMFVFKYETWLQSTEVKIEPKDPWEEDFEHFKKHRTHGTLEEEAKKETSSS